jgi:excinuclease ABC subunit C
MLIDGGKGQVGAFKNIFTDSLKIPIIGIAKRDESIIYKNFNENYKSFKLPVGPSLYFVQRLRNEAHRFARRYHHKLMKKTLLA